jgi:hypothetical protein
MSSNTRIYVVKRYIDGNTVHSLVRAQHPRQAIAAVVEREFTAAVATQEELLQLAGQVPVLDASAPPPAIPPMVAAAT